MIRERYERDGYVICRAVLDDTLVSEAGAHVDWLLARHPDLRPERLHHRLVWRDAFWVRLLRDDRVLDCVEQIIGPDIALFASHYIAKPPADGLAVLWHQDGSYWPPVRRRGAHALSRRGGVERFADNAGRGPGGPGR